MPAKKELETRTVVEWEFFPPPDDLNEPPKKFDLRKRTIRQVKFRGDWRTDSNLAGPAVTDEVVGTLTRNQVTDLIGEAASALAMMWDE